VGPRAGLYDVKKINSCLYWDSNPSVVQPVAIRYTDCAIPALIRQCSPLEFNLPRTTQHYDREDRTLHNHGSENYILVFDPEDEGDMFLRNVD
jgi:hypothetical protein